MTEAAQDVLEARNFFKMCAEVAQLTDENWHTEARLKIAAYFSDHSSSRQLQFLIAGQQTIGYLPHWADSVRNDITAAMLAAILEQHGEEVRRRIWECL